MAFVHVVGGVKTLRAEEGGDGFRRTFDIDDGNIALPRQPEFDTLYGHDGTKPFAVAGVAEDVDLRVILERKIGSDAPSIHGKVKQGLVRGGDGRVHGSVMVPATMVAAVVIVVMVVVTMVVSVVVMPAAGVTVVVIMVGALCLRVKRQFVGKEGGNCRITTTGDAAEDANVLCIQCHASTAADAAANQDFHAVVGKEISKGAVPGTVGVYDCRGDDLVIFNFVNFKLCGVPEVPEHLPVFMCDCNFHAFLLIARCAGVCFTHYFTPFRAASQTLLHEKEKKGATATYC